MTTLRNKVIHLASTLGEEERRPLLQLLAAPETKTANKRTRLKAYLKLKDGTVYPSGTSAEVVFSQRNPAVSEVIIEGRTLRLRTKGLHRHFRGFPKPPSPRTMQKWDSEGVGPTVTGQRGIEMDGYGPDGSPSWMLVLGYI